MPKCLVLGGLTAEMAIEDNSEATTALIATLTVQGTTNEGLLRDINEHTTEATKVHKATLLGIEIISDQDEGSLIDNVEED